MFPLNTGPAALLLVDAPRPRPAWLLRPLPLLPPLPRPLPPRPAPDDVLDGVVLSVVTLPCAAAAGTTLAGGVALLSLIFVCCYVLRSS